MKAVILAAGKGERLGSISKRLPKPMIRFHDKPILEYNIELCKKYGIHDIYINIHHQGNVIKEYFQDGKSFSVNINYLEEEYLHGTSGSVRRIAEEFWGYKQDQSLSHIDPFFVIYGDNFSNFNLSLLVLKTRQSNTIVSIAFHYREDISNSGVAEFDENCKILRFIEKPHPKETESKWVNAGIYLLAPEILSYIPDGYSDFGRQIFPKMIQLGIPIYGVLTSEEVIAFDTIEMMSKHNQYIDFTNTCK